VRVRFAERGWTVEIADARKAKAIAALACKTDRVDACSPSWSRRPGFRGSMIAR
jgi:hypothetical protein